MGNLEDAITFEFDFPHTKKNHVTVHDELVVRLKYITDAYILCLRQLLDTPDKMDWYHTYLEPTQYTNILS